MDFIQLSKIAIEAALSAGKIIQKHMNDDIEVQIKKEGTSHASQVVTAIDLACEKVILDHLLPTCERYDLALLSEETKDDGSRFKKDFFWCIDPMDGTLSFINKRPGFSVSISLVGKDGTPVIGVVFDPVTNTLYHGVKGQGAFKNGSPWKINNSNKHLTYVTDRMLKDTPGISEINKVMDDKMEELHLNGIKEISGGGSVLNGILVLENGPACMIKLPKKEKGGGSIWDFAATACIFHELGLTATNFNKGPLDLNKKDGTFMNQEGIFYANF